MCDICGCKPPNLKCDNCDGKLLCNECDKTWHSHPRRNKHTRVTFQLQGGIKTRNLGTKPKTPPRMVQSDNNQNINTGSGDGVPILSIFERKETWNLPKGSTSPEQNSSFNVKRNAKDNSIGGGDGACKGATGGASVKKNRTILEDLKEIGNREDRIVRIKQELGSIDIKLDQYKQEINAIFRRVDDFENNPEYQRLRKDRDRLNRDKMLIEEHWKELAEAIFKEKEQCKKGGSDSRMSNAESEKIDIKYPPSMEYKEPDVSAFDFEKNMLFPMHKGTVGEGAKSKTQGMPKRNLKLENITNHKTKPVAGKVRFSISDSNQATAWICNHCTFHNAMSDKSCAVCRKTSDNASLVYENIKEEEEEEEEDHSYDIQAEEKVVKFDELKPTKPRTTEYKSIFVDHQDEIFREKKAAKEKYEREHREEEESVLESAPPQGQSDDVDHHDHIEKPQDKKRNAVFYKDVKNIDGRYK